MGFSFVLFFWAATVFCFGNPIQNSEISYGKPKLECLSDSIAVSIQTNRPFFGRLFVKGSSHDPDCVLKSNNLTNNLRLLLPFEKCFLRRNRIFVPSESIVVTTTVIISLHPFFVTEWDSAFRLQCIYRNDRQSVSSAINVGEPPTSSVPNEEPSCHYEILENGPHGRPIPMATVGTTVYHKWMCQAASNRFCALVHSCVAEDGNGTIVTILDENGCSKDTVLLPNLEYFDDLTAGQKTTVYKFADKDSIYFQCQIMISRKTTERCRRPICAENVQRSEFQMAPNGMSPFVSFDRRFSASRRSREVDLDVMAEMMVPDIGFSKISSENCSLFSFPLFYFLLFSFFFSILLKVFQWKFIKN